MNKISWLFGALVFAAGLLNAFWGNDPGFGIFLLPALTVFLNVPGL